MLTTETAIHAPAPSAADRLKLLGVAPADYTFEFFKDFRFDHMADSQVAHSGEKVMLSPYLEEDVFGNILIYYPSISGDGIQSMPGKTEGTHTFFWRKRMAIVEDGNKYFQPKGTGIRIFFPPKTLAKIRAGENIPALHMVEGEFKAIVADHFGMDIIGLTGIQNFIAGKGNKTLHPDINYIITACGVKRLVLIGDADSRYIRFDKEDKEKDYNTRLFSFYSAVKNLKECLKERDEVDAYFCNIHSNFINSAKGLDDLYAHLGVEAAPRILEEMLKRKSTEIFEFKSISTSFDKLLDYFYLNLNNFIPEAFYNRFANLIDNEPFKFRGSIWQFNIHEGGLTMIRHADVAEYMRLGVKYIKNIYVENSQGMIDRQMIPWSKGELIQDYVIQRGVKNFIHQIPKYNAFCNIPENDPDKYQAVVRDCFNLYYKIDHEIAPGAWPNIEAFLKHLFQNIYQDKYALMLDYMTILYRFPNHPLPIVSLVSAERETGKTHFILLLKDLFKENVTMLGNSDFKDSFNADYTGKLVIGINEGYLRDKNIQEKIKSWSTDPYVNMRAMFANRQQIDNFTKIVITTNNDTDFVRIDEDEIRYLVCRVPRLPGIDPNFRKKMYTEIPAFLHFLKHREITIPETHRQWFDPRLLETESLTRLKSSSKTGLQKELDIILRNKFMYCERGVLYMSLGDIHEEINPRKSEKFSKTYIKETLEKMGIKKRDKGRYDFFGMRFEVVENNVKEWVYNWESKQNTYYIFPAELFCTKEEIIEWKLMDPENLQAPYQPKGALSNIPPATVKVEQSNEEHLNNEPSNAQPITHIPSPITFLAFWTAYGKAIDKPLVEMAWATLSDADKAMAMQHVPAYVASTPDKLYRLNPLKYLDKKAWLNEVIAPGTSHQAPVAEEIEEVKIKTFE